MKKFLSIIFLVLVLFMVSGCGNKKVITTREFKNITEQNGLSVLDAIDQFDSDVIKEATLAYNDDYKLEFYVLDSSDSAISMFNYNKNSFESKKSGVSSYLSTDLANYNIYMLQSGGYYMYLSRVDNTLLYVSVEDTFKESVKDIVKDLGY